MEDDPYYRATQDFPLENGGHASTGVIKWLISLITVHRWRKQPACITEGTWGRWGITVKGGHTWGRSCMYTYRYILGLTLT